MTPDAIIFRSAQRKGGKNIAVMGDAANICMQALPEAGRKVSVKRPDTDFDLLDFASPLPATSNAGLEYVDGAIELLEVGSAIYAVGAHYASPAATLALPDQNDPDF